MSADVEAILSIHHAPDGLQCACGLDMSRRRERGELGFLHKFDHEKHRAHVAEVLAARLEGEDDR